MTVTFDRLAYLGDSLTDTGTLYELTQDAVGIGFPLSPPYDEAVSNGPVHSDLVPGLIDVDGGLNFAVGGAKAGEETTLRDYILGDLGGLAAITGSGAFGALLPTSAAAFDTVIDLPGQTDRFLDATALGGRSDIAVAILIGANDLNVPLDDFDPVAAQAAIDAALDGVETATDRVLDAGVGEVVLYTLPGGSFFPLVSGQGATADAIGDAASVEFNTGIRALADGNDDVSLIDFGLLGDEVADDPTAFGFRSAEAHAFNGSGAFPTPTTDFFTIPEEQLMFWDEVHPTEEFHEILAVFEARSLENGLTDATGDADDLRLTGADELILAQGGDDSIVARGGDDVVLGGLGDDTLRGNTGSDVVAGGSGNDAINGGRDGDLVVGNDGDDTLRGNGGHDVLIDGNGDDEVYGGGGNDVFIYTDPRIFGGDRDDADVFDGGGGSDTLVLRLGLDLYALAQTSLFFGGSGGNVLDRLNIETSSIETLEFTRADDLPSDLDLAAGQSELLDQAELWNFA